MDSIRPNTNNNLQVDNNRKKEGGNNKDAILGIIKQNFNCSLNSDSKARTSRIFRNIDKKEILSAEILRENFL